MKKNQRIFTALIISCVLCFLVGIAGVFSAQNVNAENSFSSIALRKGASVRMADSYDEMGLRYQLTMSTKDYQDIKTLDSDVTFGILIAPLTYHQENALNEQNVFGIGGEAKYGWAEKGAEYTDSKTQIINLSTKVLGFNDKDNTYNFFGSIVKIKEQNKDKVFVGVGYALYTEGGQQKAIMVTDESNQRSMAYVAQQEIEALNEKIAIEQDEAEKALMQADVTSLTTSYVTGVTSKATAKYYKMAKNGVYEEVIGDRYETAEAQQIGNDFTAPEKDYEDEGYVLNTAISNTEGIIYANGKTELNSYYYQPNLGLVDNKTVTTFDYKSALPNATSYAFKKVIWDNETHEDQNDAGLMAPQIKVDEVMVDGGIAERKVTVSIEDYVKSNGVLDLAKIDGVYEVIANYGDGKFVSIKFDAYDSSSKDYVWNTVENSVDYSRLYVWNGGAKDADAIALDDLTDDEHTGKYLKFDCIGDPAKGNLTIPHIGGFSVLSVHSYEYYANVVLKQNPTYALTFDFKVKGVSSDATGNKILGLHGSATEPNRVYVNGTEILQDSDGNKVLSPKYKYSDSSIQPETWYTVQISLSNLLANWDNMRQKSNDEQNNSNYGFYVNKLLWWNTQNVDGDGNAFDYKTEVKDFDIWVGDFSLAPTVTIDSLDLNLDNLASESTMYNFFESGDVQTVANYQAMTGGSSRYGLKQWVYNNDPTVKCDPLPATYDGSEYTKNSITHTKNFVFARTNTTAKNKHILMAVDLSSLTLDVLKVLDNMGYKKLTYSLIFDTNYINNGSGNSSARVNLGTINFDYLKENKEKAVFWLDSSGNPTHLLNMAAFNTHTASEAHPQNWMTVEYSISDLITCYNQVFVGDYFMLGVPWARYSMATVDTETGDLIPTFYLSPIQIVK